MRERSARRLLGAAALLVAGFSVAEPDTFGVGDAHSGSRTVLASSTLFPNAHFALVADAPAGATQLSLGSVPGLAGGTLLFLHQSAGYLSDGGLWASGNPGAVDLSSSPIGHFELARVQASVGTSVSLTQPLVSSFPAGVSQVVSVPEYDTLTVDGRLTASQWSGGVGGVLVVFAKSLINNGVIDATGLGFRGGQLVSAPGKLGCVGLDEPAPYGAQRGEGVVYSRFGPSDTGRGNVANGAGGGVCENSGGGGGGAAGQGGVGGRTWPGDGSRDAGGLGGAPLVYSTVDHLVFGGGGGAGQANGIHGSAGARGGGIVFIRAGSLSGTSGTISAEGLAALDASVQYNNEGAGGGGGGGTVYLRVAGAASGNRVSAAGGRGGISVEVDVGPGGGGGGGRILFQASTSSGMSFLVDAGVAGTQPNTALPEGVHYGAHPLENEVNAPPYAGVVTTLPGSLPSPLPPVVLQPLEGSVLAEARPFFSGSAQPRSTVVLTLDGAPYVRLSVSNTGAFTYTPAADLFQGPHELGATTEWQGISSAPSTPIHFTIASAVPSGPLFTNPTEGQVVDTARPTLSGRADKAILVLLEVDGTQVATVTSDLGGNWSYGLLASQSLVDGTHTASAQARNQANVTSQVTQVSFTVNAPLDTLLTRTPDSPTHQAQATFDFYSNQTGAVFECRLDGASFLPCGHPHVVMVGEGGHAFEVRALDGQEVDSTPAHHEWEVDLTPPDTSFISNPPPTTHVPEADFELSSTEALVTFECELDGNDFVPCSAKPHFENLPEGTHRLSARAKDRAGNVDSTPVTHSWTFRVAMTPVPPGCCAQGNAGTWGPCALLLLFTPRRRQPSRRTH